MTIGKTIVIQTHAKKTEGFAQIKLIELMLKWRTTLRRILNWKLDAKWQMYKQIQYKHATDRWHCA